MAQRTVTVFSRFDVPPDRLWAAVVDHEGMSDWLGARVRVLAGRGDGGLGTVRRVELLPLLRLDEEVVGFVPPHSMTYRVIRGLPFLRYHLGEIRVRPDPTSPGGSELWWEVTLATPVPQVTNAMAAALQRTLNAGVGRLRDRL
jgi:hypothetical protein